MIRPRISRPVTILGKAPATTGEPWAPTTTSAIHLAELAGVKPSKLRDLFRLDNLVTYADPSREALRDAAALYQFDRNWAYVLTGTEVVRALGKRAKPRTEDPEHALPWHASGPGILEWYESREGIVMAVLPHPSLRNRWYNDKRCRRAAENFLREAGRS